MRSFAASLGQDYAAVAVAMEQVWSKGQVGVPGANTRKFSVSYNYFFIKDLQRL
jgi:hypothetical protein